jgi:hypothetical protein
MLLQMTFEKLGKAALLRSGAMAIDTARSSHKGAVRMVQLVARDKHACRRLGWKPENVKRLVPIVDELERAQPALAKNSPCLEYPWEDPRGNVQWPARHLPLLHSFKAKRGNHGIQLLKFGKGLCTKFDEVFS